MNRTPGQAFLDEVLDEYIAASQQRHTMHSAHEAYAVILEELDEFWEEVRLKRVNRNPAAMRKELIQVAAMCLRATLDLEL